MIIVGYGPIYTRKQLRLCEEAYGRMCLNPRSSKALRKALKKRLEEYYGREIS